MSLDGAKLICLDEHGVEGKEIEAKGKQFTIGYYINSDYILQDERAKSTHCEILCDPWSRVTIHNKCAEFPVKVDGQNVDIKQTLNSDSKISILDQNFLWKFLKTKTSEFEDIPLQEVESTTAALKQEDVKPASYSCPDLRFHRQISKRLTVHKFAYAIHHNEEGNISSDLEYSTSDIAAESSKDENVCDTTTAEPIGEQKSRSVTPELIAQSPKTELINATSNKTTKSTAKKKPLSNCRMSEVLVTSYTPRETGVRIEKSFTALLKPMTPKSIYSTPSSTANDSFEIDRSHDIMDFATPATSKNVERNLNKSSMHLIDLTTPKKLAPTIPMPKSALKSSSKYTPGQFGVKKQPATLVRITSSNNSNGSAISSQSSDVSEVVEVSSDDCSSAILQTPSKAPTSFVKLNTPKRTPHSLMKRVLLSSAKKHVAKKNLQNISTDTKTKLFTSSPIRKNVQTVGESNDDTPSTSFMAQARLMNTKSEKFVSTSTPLTVQREQKLLHGVRKSFGNVTIAGHINRNRLLNKSAQLVAKARKSLNSYPKDSESKRLSKVLSRPAISKAFSKSLGSRNDTNNRTFTLDASNLSNIESNVEAKEDKQPATRESLAPSSDEETPLVQEYDQNGKREFVKYAVEENTEKVVQTYSNVELSALHKTQNEDVTKIDSEEEENNSMTETDIDGEVDTPEEEPLKQHESIEEKDICEGEKMEKVLVESCLQHTQKGKIQHEQDEHNKQKENYQQHDDEFEEELRELLIVEQFLEDKIKECVENEEKENPNEIDEIQNEINREEESSNFEKEDNSDLDNEISSTSLLLADEKNMKNHSKLHQDDVELITSKDQVESSISERETDVDLLEDIDYKSDKLKHQTVDEEENCKNLTNTDVHATEIENLKTASDDEGEVAEHSLMHINKKEVTITQTAENIHTDDEKENHSKITTMNTPNLRGVRELLQTPKEVYAKSPHLSAFRNLLRTPKGQELNVSDNLDGIQSLLSLSEEQAIEDTEITTTDAGEFNNIENESQSNLLASKSTVKEQESTLTEEPDLKTNDCDLNVTVELLNEKLLDKTTDLKYNSNLPENKCVSSTSSELKRCDELDSDSDAEKKNDKSDEIDLLKETTENSEIITPKEGDCTERTESFNEKSNKSDIEKQEIHFTEIEEGFDNKSNKSDISGIYSLDQSTESVVMDPLQITSSSSSIANACDENTLIDEEIPETQTVEDDVDNDESYELNESCEIPETQAAIDEECKGHDTFTNEKVSILDSGGKYSDSEASFKTEEKHETSIESFDAHSFTVNTLQVTFENDKEQNQSVSENDKLEELIKLKSKNEEYEDDNQNNKEIIDIDQDDAEVESQFVSELSNHSKSGSDFASEEQLFDENDLKVDLALDKSKNTTTNELVDVACTNKNSEENLNNVENEDTNEISSSKEDCQESENLLAGLTNVDKNVMKQTDNSLAENGSQENTIDLLESENIFDTETDLEVQSTNESPNDEHELIDKNNDIFQAVENELKNIFEPNEPELDKDMVEEKSDTIHFAVAIDNVNALISNNQIEDSEEVTEISSTTNEENIFSAVIEQEKVEIIQTQNVTLLKNVDNVIEGNANKDLPSLKGIEVEKSNETDLSSDDIKVVDSTPKSITISEEALQQTDVVQPELETFNTNGTDILSKNTNEDEIDKVNNDVSHNQKDEKNKKKNKEEQPVIVGKRVTRGKRNVVPNTPTTIVTKTRAKKAVKTKTDTPDPEPKLEEPPAGKHEEEEKETPDPEPKLEEQPAEEQKETKQKQRARGKAKELSQDAKEDEAESHDKSKELKKPGLRGKKAKQVTKTDEQNDNSLEKKVEKEISSTTTESEDVVVESAKNKKSETISVAKRAARGNRKDITETEIVHEISSSESEKDKSPPKIEEKRVTRGKRKGQAQIDSVETKRAANDDTAILHESKASTEVEGGTAATKSSGADDEETIYLAEEGANVLKSSRGRLRKPVAAVQQFIEEVRARSATPKRLKTQQSAFTSTPQSVAKKTQLLLIAEDLPSTPTDISAVLSETKETTLTMRTRRAVARGASQELQLTQNASHTRRPRKILKDSKDTIPLEVSQSENVSLSLKRGAQQTEDVSPQEIEPKEKTIKKIPVKRGKKNVAEETNGNKLIEESLISADTQENNSSKRTVNKRTRKASLDSVPETLATKRKAKENVETLESATEPQKTTKTSRTRKVISKEDEMKPELKPEIKKTTRARRGAKKAEEDVTETTEKEKPKSKNSKTKQSEASVVEIAVEIEKPTTSSTRAQRGRKRQISEAPEEESKNEEQKNSSAKPTRGTRGRKIVHFNSDNTVEQDETNPSPPKRATRARRRVL